SFSLNATSIDRRSTLSLHDALPIFGAVFVEAVGAQRRAEGEAGGSLGRLYLRLVADIDRETRLGFAGAVEVGEEIAAEIQEARIDRKSTRLNSSHGSISYAVFCLKK